MDHILARNTDDRLVAEIWQRVWPKVISYGFHILVDFDTAEHIISSILKPVTGQHVGLQQLEFKRQIPVRVDHLNDEYFPVNGVPAHDHL